MQDRTIPDSDISVSSSWSDSTAARHSRYMTLGVTSRELFYVPFYALPAPPFEKAQTSETYATWWEQVLNKPNVQAGNGAQLGYSSSMKLCIQFLVPQKWVGWL